MVDGEFQKVSVETGAYIRQLIFGKDPRLLKLVEDLPDHALRALRLGGHDPRKVYAAYKAAVDHKGSPTVILARTIKGYGLGESGEGRNISHQQKKLNEDELREFRSRFGIPISDAQLDETPFYRPDPDSREIQYLQEQRKLLGGYVPRRSVRSQPIAAEHDELFKEFSAGSEGREVSTTMAFVGMLRKMMRDPEIGKLVVPIVPDEARTFGMESLFRQASAFTIATGNFMSRWTATLFFTTRKRPTARFWKKESPRQGHFLRLSRQALRTRRTASIPFPSSSTTQCLAYSASMT